MRYSVIYINHDQGEQKMQLRGDDNPPSRRMKRYWKIAVLANIKDDTHPKPEGVPPDAFADFDHIETIDAIRSALETDGHQTVFIHADADLPYALRDERPDICFNIAEEIGRASWREGEEMGGSDEVGKQRYE